MLAGATDDTDRLSGKVAFLSALDGVERVVETHSSFVFLTDRHAYKLKKPVRLGYSDCRSLASRERAISKELWLNRQLAGDVYVGRLALCQKGGRFSIGGTGPVADWLLLMKRLPDGRMLDGMIARGTYPSNAEVAALSDILIAFYARQADRPLPHHLCITRMERELALDLSHLAAMRTSLPVPDVLASFDVVPRLLRDRRHEVAKRERNRLVIDGHGDLRPEHVCLTTPPVVFDRIEASFELRVADVWDEAMFLAAETALLGYARLGEVLGRNLRAAGFPEPSPQLLLVFLVLRLLTRARLSIDHLRDADCRDRPRWPRRAQVYLDAASGLLRASPMASPLVFNMLSNSPSSHARTPLRFR